MLLDVIIRKTGIQFIKNIYSFVCSGSPIYPYGYSRMTTKKHFMPPIERLTNQKKAIIDFLRTTKGHPDAYEIYDVVKKKLPQISLATVYRNLDTLVKQEKIKALRIKNDRFNYDGVEHHHHHFRCNNCNSVFNIEGDILLDYEKINESGVAGLVEEYDIMLRGICINCQRKEKK